VPRALANLERLHKKNGSEIFWIGDTVCKVKGNTSKPKIKFFLIFLQISIADIKLWSTLDIFDKKRNPGSAEHYHRLMRIHEEVTIALSKL
jgi:hypothetical protein